MPCKFSTTDFSGAVVFSPQGRKKVAPGEAKYAVRRTKRNPGKTPFNEVFDFRSRHRQTRQNSKQPQPKIFHETFIRDWKSLALVQLSRTTPAHICPIQQQNNKLAILIGRGIREFCRDCRGANGDLNTYLMTICPQVSLRTAAAALRFTWGYYLPALRALTAATRNPQGGSICPGQQMNNTQPRFLDKN
ncbi:MAG: hypothetical protein HZA50_12135 [Planctomycetes bacterium]|nr:hypothetical protein [Planctomycetota bacterium]